jgi:hypothetical protein
VQSTNWGKKKKNEVARSVPCALLLPLQHFLVKPLFRSFGEECSAAKELLKAVSLLYCSTLHAGCMSAKQSLQAPKQLLYICCIWSWETSIYILLYTIWVLKSYYLQLVKMELLWWSAFVWGHFFCDLATKRNPVPTHQKDFCEKQCAKGTRFFEDFFFPPWNSHI